MSRERQLIENTYQTLGDMPTLSSLVEELRMLGVAEGMTLLVHSSLSSIGWVPGGAVAVIQALQRALGEEGTLIMPTHTGNLSDPARWGNPPAPQSWWERIRSEMPAYDAMATPVYAMGMIPETFRRMSGVIRSAHPHLSFAAWGRRAEEVIRGHGEGVGGLGEALGEESPIGRVYAADGLVLLIGVGYDSNTSLHLSEYRAAYEGKEQELRWAPVTDNGERRWICYEDLKYETDDFERIGVEFERSEQASGNVRAGKLGMANVRLMRQRALVDYGTEWMERCRPLRPDGTE